MSDLSAFCEITGPMETLKPDTQTFDYNILPKDVYTEVKLSAERIKMRMKRTVEDIIEIGRELSLTKQRLPHGKFMSWILDNEMTLFTKHTHITLGKQQYPCEILANNQMLYDGHTVYHLSDPRNGEVVYVGKTSNLTQRAIDHCRVSIYKPSRLDQRKIAIFSSGLPVILAPVFKCKDADDADYIEQVCISLNKKTILNVQKYKWNNQEKY